jgi:putative tricarboxylic transport membrane protein
MLAFVLGEMLEKSLRQSLILSQGSPLIFITRPISFILLLVVLFMIVSPVLPRLLKARRLTTILSQVRKAARDDD